LKKSTGAFTAGCGSQNADLLFTPDGPAGPWVLLLRSNWLLLAVLAGEVVWVFNMIHISAARSWVSQRTYLI